LNLGGTFEDGSEPDYMVPHIEGIIAGHGIWDNIAMRAGLISSEFNNCFGAGQLNFKVLTATLTLQSPPPMPVTMVASQTLNKVNKGKYWSDLSQRVFEEVAGLLEAVEKSAAA
jgi:hypothetical protein